jgi:hypothetical protein
MCVALGEAVDYAQEQNLKRLSARAMQLGMTAKWRS